MLGLVPNLEVLLFPRESLRGLILMPKFRKGKVSAMEEPYRKGMKIKYTDWELFEIILMFMSSVA